MFDKSQQGILFSRETVLSLKDRLIGLKAKAGFDSVLELMAILHQLSQADGMKTLSSVGFDDHHARSNSRRIMKVFEYLNDRYSEPISLADMARQIGRASCRERVDGPRVAGAVHTAQDQRES